MKKFLLFCLLISLIQINSLESKKDLFDVTQLKYLKLKNRVFKGAIEDLGAFENGKITDKILKRYDTLSKSEIGNIITGIILVEPEPNGELPIPTMDKDEYIEEYKKLTDIVHKNEANIFAQISFLNDINISKEEINRYSDLFADAAIRIKKAGFDGLEICANHHVTLSQFLSPMFNHRTDEYGGSDENRARIVVEIIEKMRKKIGDEFIMILKINSEDDDPNGITPEGFITACKMAEKAGIDMIDITGMKWKKNRENKMVYYDIGKTLANILKIPVMITGGGKDLNVINDVLNNSNIQYIGICRAILSEPDIIIKWKNCKDKKAQCVSCMKCYEVENFYNHECIINKRKKAKKNKNLA